MIQKKAYKVLSVILKVDYHSLSISLLCDHNMPCVKFLCLITCLCRRHKCFHPQYLYDCLSYLLLSARAYINDLLNF